ncbi:hypothetical protein Tco_1477699, partial [Tanacetum coccineum]
MHSWSTSRLVSSEWGYAFQFLFREKFDSFKNIFDHNIDQLKKQLDKEELHKCDSKTCLASDLTHQKKKFQEYAHYDTESLKKTILSYLNSIRKEIDERARHEEELRIKEIRDNDELEKLEMEKQETLIQKGECNSLGDNSDANKEKQAKEKCIVFQQAFRLFFGEEVEYFAPRMFFNLDKLEKQLNNKEFDEEVSMVIFKVFKNQFQHQMDSVEKATVERELYKRVHDNKVNERTMQTQEGMVYMVNDKCDVALVVTESS